MIEKCSFGRMTIDGQVYTADLMIFPDGTVAPRWRRQSGHVLTLDDIAGLIAASPELVVVGSGIFGRMKPSVGLREELAAQGIDLVVAWTKEAVGRFNSARTGSRRAGGCFHLTC